MDFSYDYWLGEVALFREQFADPGTSDEVLGLLVRGICYEASQAVRLFPERKDEVMEDFGSCLALAKARMGATWFFEHAEIISTHLDDSPT
jgi:hypothetical protein